MKLLLGKVRLDFDDGPLLDEPEGINDLLEAHPLCFLLTDYRFEEPRGLCQKLVYVQGFLKRARLLVVTIYNDGGQFRLVSEEDELVDQVVPKQLLGVLHNKITDLFVQAESFEGCLHGLFQLRQSVCRAQTVGTRRRETF